MKAEIFLSCGQNPKYGEPEIAEEIKKKIESLGFDCFVAKEEQSLECLRDVVFKHLEEADYFVFIDFKREELVEGKTSANSNNRGSLYANQELAVAAYLGLAHRVLLLQEKGVKERDGILSAVLANLNEGREIFQASDRTNLPDRVCELIQMKLQHENDHHRWTNQTRNTLAMSACLSGPRVLPQPFHVKVENRHHRKLARNCSAYIVEVQNMENGRKLNQEEKWETVELKWANTTSPSVRISPQSYRIFGSFWLTRPNGSQINLEFFFRTAPSTTDYFPHKLDPGDYRLTYSVVSENFKSVQHTFEFRFDQSIHEALNTWVTANEQTG